MGDRVVFLVQHLHVQSDGEEDVKDIGMYSSREMAEGAVERLRRRPGFRDTPDGFSINAYTIDVDNWTEGYTTIGDSEA